MAINRTSPKKGKVVDIPTAPTIGTATAGPAAATVAFTAATIGGPATTYTALSSPGSITGTGSSSPVTVSGLTAGTAYTFTVRGNNATGSGEYSASSNSIVPDISTSFESIATLTSGNTLTFSSIPQTYKHLQIRANWNAGGSTSDLSMRINSSNPTEAHSLFGNGTSVGSGSGDWNASYGWWPIHGNFNSNYPNYPTAFIIDILNYTDTNKFKTIRAISGSEYNSGDTKSRIGIKSAFWSTTSAITSITFSQLSGSLGSGTTFALYGIKG